MEKTGSEAVRTAQGQRGAGSEGAEEGEPCGAQGQAVEEGLVGGGRAWAGRPGDKPPRLWLPAPQRPGPRRSPAAKAKLQSKSLELSGGGRSFHFVVFKIFS